MIASHWNSVDILWKVWSHSTHWVRSDLIIDHMNGKRSTVSYKQWTLSVWNLQNSKGKTKILSILNPSNRNTVLKPLAIGRTESAKGSWLSVLWLQAHTRNWNYCRRSQDCTISRSLDSLRKYLARMTRVAHWKTPLEDLVWYWTQIIKLLST